MKYERSDCQEAKILAVIPARGGSKRIPHKNIKEFCGKPILAYSIEAAIDSNLFDEVMVSTDDPHIANIAKSYGAGVPFFRSEKAANDYSTITDVLIEVVSEYEKIGKYFSITACIYPTAPFVTAEKLKAAFDLLCKSDATALLPVVPFSFPPLRGVEIENDRARMKWPENTFVRSQDLETIYHDCGQFHFIQTDTLLTEKRVISKNTVPMVLSEIEVQDIDNDIDWELAELKYMLLKKKELL